jgi:uncharacterized protein (DUF362 family)
MTTSSVGVHVRRLTDADAPGRVLDMLIAGVGGLESRVGRGDVVLIKPNFVAPFSQAATDLRFIDHFVGSVRALGAKPVLGESSGFEFDTRSAFKVLGVDVFAKALGVELVDFEDGGFMQVELGDGLPSVPIANIALEAKLIVNLPVLKGHTITRMTGAVKNLFGLVRKDTRRYLHSHHLEPSIAAIARRLSHAVHFVDARRHLERAVFAQPRPLGYALASADPFAVDHFGSRLLGVDPDWVAHLAGAPSYAVHGDTTAALPIARRQNSVRQRLHRCLYSGFYWLDHLKHKTFGGESIIYDLHWYLGIHPALRNVSAGDAVRVAASCPVGAIDADRRVIDRHRCRTVRCLQCHREHPQLVELRGLNRPRRENLGA